MLRLPKTRKQTRYRPEIFRRRIEARMDFHRNNLYYDGQGIIISKPDLEQLLKIVESGIDNNPIFTLCTDGEFRLTMELARGYGICAYIFNTHEWVYELTPRESEVSIIATKSDLMAFKQTMPYITARHGTAFGIVFDENIPCIIVSNCSNGQLAIINGVKKYKNSTLVRSREMEYYLQSRTYFKFILPYEEFRECIRNMYTHGSGNDYMFIDIHKDGRIYFKVGVQDRYYMNLRDYYLYNSPPVWWGSKQDMLSISLPMTALRNAFERTDSPEFTTITMYVYYKSLVTLMVFTLNNVEYRYTFFPNAVSRELKTLEEMEEKS